MQPSTVRPSRCAQTATLYPLRPRQRAGRVGTTSFIRRPHKSQTTDAEPPMAAKVGLFGANVGRMEAIDGMPKALTQVDIWSTSGSGGYINGISFKYKDTGGTEVTAGVWGRKTGERQSIVIPANNHMIKLSGTVIPDIGVTSLRFVTDEPRTYEYGDNSGTPFKIPVEDTAIVAFFGRAAENLKALGAYVVPLART